MTRLMKTGNWRDIDFQISHFVHRDLYRPEGRKIREKWTMLPLQTEAFFLLFFSLKFIFAFMDGKPASEFSISHQFYSCKTSSCESQSRLRFICFINAFRAFKTIQNPEGSFKTPHDEITESKTFLTLNCNLAYTITAILSFSRHDRLSLRFF